MPSKFCGRAVLLVYCLGLLRLSAAIQTTKQKARDLVSDDNHPLDYHHHHHHHHHHHNHRATHDTPEDDIHGNKDIAQDDDVPRNASVPLTDLDIDDLGPHPEKAFWCAFDPNKDSKVFINSLPKTATSSLGNAMKQLKFRDCGSNKWLWYGMKAYKYFWKTLCNTSYHALDYWADKRDSVFAQTYRMVNKYNGTDALNMPNHVKQKLKEEWHTFKGMVDNMACDDFSDFPIGFAGGIDIRIKTLLWPNARYVWIDRPFEEWYKSWIKHWQRHDNGQGGAGQKMKISMEDERTNMPEIYGTPHTLSREDAWAQYNTQRNLFLAFRNTNPAQFLMIDIKDLNYPKVSKLLFPNRYTEVKEHCFPDRQKGPDCCIAPFIKFPQANEGVR